MSTPMTVLILEDEFMIAMEFEAVIRQAGFEVIGPAASVESALELIDAAPPSAGVLDVNLGHGATSAPIAERLTAIGVPFVLCTGYRESDLARHFGVSAPVLQKPVDTARLVEILRSLVPAAG